MKNQPNAGVLDLTDFSQPLHDHAVEKALTGPKLREALAAVGAG
jgi:hypothetical protein